MASIKELQAQVDELTAQLATANEKLAAFEGNADLAAAAEKIVALQAQIKQLAAAAEKIGALEAEVKQLEELNDELQEKLSVAQGIADTVKHPEVEVEGKTYQIVKAQVTLKGKVLTAEDVKTDVALAAKLVKMRSSMMKEIA